MQHLTDTSVALHPDVIRFFLLFQGTGIAELLTSVRMDRLCSRDDTLLEHKSPWQGNERVDSGI